MASRLKRRRARSGSGSQPRETHGFPRAGTKQFRDRTLPATKSAGLAVLSGFYETLSAAQGPMNWWPAKTAFEIVAGAILTQNTAWVNVERAISNLRREGLLTARAIERVPRETLARHVRPSGYFRQKAKKLKEFVRFLRHEFGGSLPRMFRTPTFELREKLLGVHGIGPETADSILLYAGKHPVFVIDAYTRRVLHRHGLISDQTDYEEIRALFEASLPRDTALYSEYHALLVDVGKKWCRPRDPRCSECPLGPYLDRERGAGPAALPARNSEAQ